MIILLIIFCLPAILLTTLFLSIIVYKEIVYGDKTYLRGDNGQIIGYLRRNRFNGKVKKTII